MQQDHNIPTSQILRDVEGILAKHYGIKIASLIETSLANGVSLDALVEAYYGKPANYKQKRSFRQGLRHFVSKYGKEVA